MIKLEKIFVLLFLLGLSINDFRYCLCRSRWKFRKGKA